MGDTVAKTGYEAGRKSDLSFETEPDCNSPEYWFWRFGFGLGLIHRKRSNLFLAVLSSGIRNFRSFSISKKIGMGIILIGIISSIFFGGHAYLQFAPITVVGKILAVIPTTIITMLVNGMLFLPAGIFDSIYEEKEDTEKSYWNGIILTIIIWWFIIGVFLSSTGKPLF